MEFLLHTPILDKLEVITEGSGKRLDQDFKDEAIDIMTYAKWYRYFTFLATFVFMYSWLQIFKVKMTFWEDDD